MNSIKKNFFYNILYQILTLIMPLITTPYISRVIGAEGQGIFSYTYSIAQYFLLFAMLGVSNYGNRMIAKNRNDKNELSKKFWSIYALQMITTLIMVFIYLIYIIFFVNQYKIYAIIQLIYILSALFDISWFFFGLEKFKLTVTRNTMIKILSVLSIFLLVKKQSDLWLYCIIMVVMTLISQLSLWPFLKKEIIFVKPKWKEIKKHIKPNIILFIPVIAVSLYKIMDKIMIGMFSTMKEVGYYENAEKIINVPLSFITALGTVMLPRATNLIAIGKNEQIKMYIDKSMKFVLFASIPIVLGLIAVGQTFAPTFFGDEFIKTGYIIQLLAVTIIFISWANVIRTQYLIPKEKDKIYIKSVCLGAVINLVCNSALIPKFGAIGASIGTVLAEFSVMFYQTIFVRTELPINKYIKYLIKFLILGIIMFVIVKLQEFYINNKFILLVVQVLVGVLVYYILNIKYINNYMLNPLLNKLKKKGE